ncbi:MAG: DNA polymerase III subunit delta [Oscillospiraceae bacterium]|nr:DNA polymerase III subunit delta [Oscillospiraceae bacterium]
MAKYEATQSGLQLLKAAIKEGNLAPLYFFHGEETFLLHHYLERIKKQRIDELTESFNFHKLTTETFDIQILADAVENLPMMAEHTLVWVDEIDLFKLAEADRNKVAEILTDIPDYCCVIFTYETTAWKPDKRQKKLWDVINTHGQIVEFAKQDQRDLIPWIIRHFAARKKTISSDLALYLIEITGGTMTSLAGEIAKICAYSGADAICRADIDAVTEPVMDAVVYQMTDMLGRGEYGKALQKLNQLLKMQQEPIAILGAIGGHIRKLSAARILLDNGRGSQDMMKLYGMSDYPARKTMDTARRFSAEFCSRALELILEADNQLKTSYDDPDRILEMLILRMAQEARHG